MKKGWRTAAATAKTCQITPVYLHSFRVYEKLKHALPLARDPKSLFTMSHTSCHSHQFLAETWYFFNDDANTSIQSLKQQNLNYTCIICAFFETKRLAWHEEQLSVLSWVRDVVICKFFTLSEFCMWALALLKGKKGWEDADGPSFSPTCLLPWVHLEGLL